MMGRGNKMSDPIGDFMKSIPEAEPLTKEKFEIMQKAMETEMNIPLGLQLKIADYEVKLAFIHSMAVQATARGKMINPKDILEVIES